MSEYCVEYKGNGGEITQKERFCASVSVLYPYSTTILTPPPHISSISLIIFTFYSLSHLSYHPYPTPPHKYPIPTCLSLSQYSHPVVQ